MQISNLTVDSGVDLKLCNVYTPKMSGSPVSQRGPIKGRKKAAPPKGKPKEKAKDTRPGSLTVSVRDQTGAGIPKPKIEILGPQKETKTGDARGSYRWSKLKIGTYSVRAYAGGRVQVQSVEITPARSKAVSFTFAIAAAPPEPPAPPAPPEPAEPPEPPEVPPAPQGAPPSVWPGAPEIPPAAVPPSYYPPAAPPYYPPAAPPYYPPAAPPYSPPSPPEAPPRRAAPQEQEEMAPEEPKPGVPAITEKPKVPITTIALIGGGVLVAGTVGYFIIRALSKKQRR